ncbi:unnamed protein product [Tuber melanosporum]|uniref:(Perigord truffle) hypothetical protein n=1 Tax=Tuber melanosporum (strain Mel28) TaxID=656061 RepID=D5GEP2_TUBMM|nr:uncharacterized protein GSTUM_00001302001 [Tuber melanosporum]CAZ82985.1 unnamed protein product [Tuber melanosporum]
MSSDTLPRDFLWGYATSSGQIEGSPEVDGRGLSIWDTFSRQGNTTEDGRSSDFGTDSYIRWKEDIALMKSYGVNCHRFSISWSRVIPLGGRTDPINPAGIPFYRTFIQSLLEAGIQPMPTLFHWDLPQALQDRYKGFLNKEEIVADFTHYARVVFEGLGDLVKVWVTINEPNVYAALGHCIGAHAPGRSSDRTKSPEGDSLVEPYIVGHNLLLAHAAAVKVYREEIAQQGGSIGLVINANWAEPYDQTDQSIAAAERYFTICSLWFADPVHKGDYPDLLKEILGDRLPEFAPEEKVLLMGSSDFFGLNHYTTYYTKVRTTPAAPTDFRSQFFHDVEETITSPDGKEIGPEAGLPWVRPVPWGFKKVLRYLWERYGKDIYVTENGVICPGEKDMKKEEAVEDDFRIDYYRSYINVMAELINEGVPIKSYLAWTFADNFEWQEGYTAKFGVTFVDTETGDRTPKKSAGFLREFMGKKMGKHEASLDGGIPDKT